MPFLLLPLFPYLTLLCVHVCVFSPDVEQQQQQPGVLNVVVIPGRTLIDFIGRHQVFYASISWCSCFHIQSSGSVDLAHRVEPLPLESCSVPEVGSGLGARGVLGEPQLVAPNTPHAKIMQIQTPSKNHNSQLR